METCPHGARISLEDGQPVVFVDECSTCQALLDDLGFAAKVVHHERRPVAVA